MTIEHKMDVANVQDVQDILDMRARAGWELVAVDSWRGEEKSSFFLFFKRVKD